MWWTEAFQWCLIILLGIMLCIVWAHQAYVTDELREIWKTIWTDSDKKGKWKK